MSMLGDLTRRCQWINTAETATSTTLHTPKGVGRCNESVKDQGRTQDRKIIEWSLHLVDFDPERSCQMTQNEEAVEEGERYCSRGCRLCKQIED